MIYKILQTGSDGNCTIVNGKLAIDMGVAFKKIEPYKNDLRLVLLTHEHHDHFSRSTVRRLAQDRPTLRWGCCEWMVPHLLEAGVDPRNIDLYEINPEVDYTYVTLGIRVRPERLDHNVQNCGYHISNWTRDDWLFYATDTGSLDGISARGYDLYLVEANHVEAELKLRMEAKLEAGEFAYESAAAQNHLSWEKAIDWLHDNMGPNSIWIPMHGHKEKGGEEDGMVRSAPDAG